MRIGVSSLSRDWGEEGSAYVFEGGEAEPALFNLLVLIGPALLLRRLSFQFSFVAKAVYSYDMLLHLSGPGDRVFRSEIATKT